MSDLRFPKINTIVLSGRLTRDVDLRYIPNGTPVAKLSLAFDRSYQKDGEWQQETSYIDIVVWSKRAEQCAEFLHKGSPIIVEGYLKTRTYVDKDNQNRKITEIVANKVNFLERAGTQPSGLEDTQEKEIVKNDSAKDITDDDVPF